MLSPAGNFIIFGVSATPAKYGELADRLNAGPSHRWSAFVPGPRYDFELGVLRAVDDLELFLVTSEDGLLKTTESLDAMLELAIEAYRKPKNYPRHVPKGIPNP